MTRPIESTEQVAEYFGKYGPCEIKEHGEYEEALRFSVKFTGPDSQKALNTCWRMEQGRKWPHDRIALIQFFDAPPPTRYRPFLEKWQSAEAPGGVFPRITGVVDEQALSTLGVECLLMQNPTELGDAIARQPAAQGIFDKWHPMQQEIVDRLGNMYQRERDIQACFNAATVFEERITGQFASDWFYSGACPEMPFFPRDFNRAFCEHCGEWIEEGFLPGSVSLVGANKILHAHLQTCTRKVFDLPSSSNKDGGDHLKGFRMFQQTIGSDIGVTIQFHHAEDGKVRLKICAPFERLLQRMLWMGYWAYDNAKAKWRILKNQPMDDVTTEHREPPRAFKMKNSLDIPPAPTPDCLLHDLKGQQPHTLAWMYSREGRGLDGRISAAVTPAGFKSRQRVSRRVAGSDIKVEFEVERSFDRVRGGILADQMGYGKTACTIAFIAQTHLQDPLVETAQDWEKEAYAREYVFTDATLIVTPANLFDQWSTEFNKFIDQKKLKLNIIRIGNHTDIKKYSTRDFVNADVVLLSVRLFLCEEYSKHFDAELHRNLAFVDEQDENHFTSRMVRCRKRNLQYMKDNSLQDLLDSKALVEAFYWKRVVFDEFHEIVLQCLQKNHTDRASLRCYYSLRHLHSRYHWGLTATPLLANSNQVSQMASLMHIFIPHHDHEEAKRFVDEYLRANEWNVGAISLEEELVHVTHTVRERALYMHQQQITAGDSGVSRMTNRAKEELLQFCSHFDPNGPAPSVDCAVENVRKADEKKLVELKQKLEIEESKKQELDKKLQIEPAWVNCLRAVKQDAPSWSHTESRNARMYFVHGKDKRIVELITCLQAALDDLYAGDYFNQRYSSRGFSSKAKEFREEVTKMRNEGSNKTDHNVMSHQVKCADCRTVGRLIQGDGSIQELIDQRSSRIAEFTSEINGVERSLNYLNATIDSLCGGGAKVEECPICFDGMPADETMTITKCGHRFHGECIREELNTRNRCPQCREPCTVESLTNVASLQLMVIKVPELAQGGDDRHKRRRKYGSKILAVIDLIEKIQTNNAKDKVLVFVQWDQIRDHVADAIRTVIGFEPHMLKGRTADRTNVRFSLSHIKCFPNKLELCKCFIKLKSNLLKLCCQVLRSFQYGQANKDNVLLLSLEHGATGINLTCANHAILVHPMFGQNATDFEKQAIGRIRRQGQTKTCHLYR